MASAQNKVIAGYLSGCKIHSHYNGLSVGSIPGFEYIDIINKKTIMNYETITEETLKSGTSAILRGAAGAAFLGPIGLLAGLSAKNKGIYTIAVEWKSEKKSLIEIDDKLYKQLVKTMF